MERSSAISGIWVPTSSTTRQMKKMCEKDLLIGAHYQHRLILLLDIELEQAKVSILPSGF